MIDERDTRAYAENKRVKKKYDQPRLNVYGNILDITRNVSPTGGKNDPADGMLKTS